MEKDYLKVFLDDIDKESPFNAQLNKVRKGTPAVRKAAVKELASTHDARVLIESTLGMLAEKLEDSEREKLEKMLIRVLQSQPRLGAASPLVQIAPALVDYVRQILPDQRSLSRRRDLNNSFGYSLVANLAQLIGLKMYITILRSTFDKVSELPMNAVFLAIGAQTFGMPLMMPLLRTLIKDKHHVVCNLGLAVIQDLPHFRLFLLPLLPSLVQYCSVPLRESALSNAANSAVTSLANYAAPHGFSAFEPILPSLWSGVQKRKGRSMIAYLRSLSAIASTAPQGRRSEIALPVLEIATGSFSGLGENDEKRNTLAIAGRCAFFVDEDVVVKLLNTIFDHFWHEYVDARMALVVLNTTSDLPLEPSLVVKEVIQANVLVNDDMRMVEMGLQLVARILKDGSSLVLDRRSEERLIDGLMAALPNSEPIKEDGILEAGQKEEEEHIYNSWVSVKAVANVVRALPGASIISHSRQLMTTLLERDTDPSPEVRQNSLQILASIVDLFPTNQQNHVLRRLYEELGEPYPDVLAEVISAISATIHSIFSKDESPDSSFIGEIITRISPILRNRHEKVQQSCIKAVNSLAGYAGEAVPAREWMHICFELLELQKSPKQSIRFDATAAFASIAAVVGPADVVSTLINHLKSPDRQFRITTSAAIASVAAETGAFTTLPVLLNEYSRGDLVVQHGVLKTIAFLFEFLENRDSSVYIDSLVTFIDDALLTSNQVHRQTAAAAIHHMAEASIGEGKEAIFLNFLNELLPSIFETSSHVIDRVLEAIHSIQKVIGVPTFVLYLWPGLFHPARKVRNVYWEMWSMMYKDFARFIVPFYPVDVPNPLGAGDIRDVWF